MKPIEHNELATPVTLSKKVVRGGVWIFSLRILNRGLDFFRIIILARLLSPTDFGLFGVAILSISVFETFSQTGFNFALIQKKESIKTYLDTAWTISALRGLALFILVFFSAPIIAAFFNAPQATLIVRFLAISLIFNGFQNIGILFFQKELEFNRLFLLEISTTITSFASTIILAVLLKNVWALVIGGLLANFVRFCISYVIQSYRPIPKIEKDKVLELFSFGKWIFLSTIVIFLVRQGDDFFLGKVLGVTALGFYQMAFMIGNLPSSEITGIISQVAFPTYTKLKSTPGKLNEAYIKTISFIALISFPFAGGIFVLAPYFTTLFLGEKWLPIVTPLQILAISGLIRSIVATGGSLFNAIGKPRFDFKMNLWRLIIIIVTIYPLTRLWSISGTSLSVLLGLSASGYIWLRGSMREMNISLKRFLVISLPSLSSTLLMLGIISAITSLILSQNYSFLSFFISIIAGVFVYFGGIWFMDRYTGLNTLGAFDFIFSNLKS